MGTFLSRNVTVELLRATRKAGLDLDARAVEAVLTRAHRILSGRILVKEHNGTKHFSMILPPSQIDFALRPADIVREDNVWDRATKAFEMLELSDAALTIADAGRVVVRRIPLNELNKHGFTEWDALELEEFMYDDVPRIDTKRRFQSLYLDPTEGIGYRVSWERHERIRSREEGVAAFANRRVIFASLTIFTIDDVPVAVSPQMGAQRLQFDATGFMDPDEQFAAANYASLILGRAASEVVSGQKPTAADRLADAKVDAKFRPLHADDCPAFFEAVLRHFLLGEKTGRFKMALPRERRSGRKDRNGGAANR